MAPLLEFINVSCAAAEPVEELSFSIGAGENTVFFGVEESGLWTLTQLMLNLEELYTGDIRYRGATLQGLDYLGKLRYKNEIGYLHGDYGLISNLTVEQNISMRLEYYSDYSPEEISGITERLMGDLNILDTRGARPVALTASQIFRTAYGRAVAHDPDLLIIEHAFVGQSPLNIRSFMDVLKRRVESRDQSVVFVTYDPQKFLDFADTFRMLYRGRMVFSGTRREFLESDNPYLVQYRDVALEGPMEIS
jgi:ABC-type transporter Mla maintaining outer membrane lipid asymmetry ATPase subunit MlaF